MKARLAHLLASAERREQNVTVMVKQQHVELHGIEADLGDLINRYVEQRKIKHVELDTHSSRIANRIVVGRIYSFCHKPEGKQLRHIDCFLYPNYREIKAYTRAKGRHIRPAPYEMTVSGLAEMARKEILDLAR